MRLLIFSDNHFCSNSSIVRSKGNKYSVRLENQIQSLNWVNQLAIDKQCDKMICLGDFFDSASLNSEEISALKEIEWNNIPKYFLVGNHEMGSNDLSLNSTNALHEIGQVIDKVSADDSFGYRLIYLPYILEENRKDLDYYIHELYNGMFETQEVKHTIILSHNDLKGLTFGKYQSKQGFDIKDIENYCDLFINGHLHNQTQISKKILNLGNLTGQNFSEDGFKYSHCAAILDTDTLQMELINNPYAFYFYKIEAKDLNDLENQISRLDNNYSIGTIKIPEQYLKEARELCDSHFKCYRLMIIPNLNVEQTDKKELIKVDHIQQFKDCLVERLGISDILNEELSLL